MRVVTPPYPLVVVEDVVLELVGRPRVIADAGFSIAEFKPHSSVLRVDGNVVPPDVLRGCCPKRRVHGVGFQHERRIQRFNHQVPVKHVVPGECDDVTGIACVSTAFTLLSVRAL